MSAPYTLTNLSEVQDSAPDFGLGDVQEARFANDALGTEDTGLSYHHLRPGKRPPFAHRHEDAEEVYVVLSGSGQIKVEDEVVELVRLDAIRVGATATRAFEAGPEGLELLAFGPRRPKDGEVVQGWWTD